MDVHVYAPNQPPCCGTSTEEPRIRMVEVYPQLRLGGYFGWSRNGDRGTYCRSTIKAVPGKVKKEGRARRGVGVASSMSDVSQEGFLPPQMQGTSWIL